MAQARGADDMPLDRNESYWLLDEELLAACKGYGVRELSTYPDYGELKSEIAAYAGVSVDQVCLTPGSDAAIESIARELVGENGEVIMPVPTFYGYESILERASANIRPIAYTENGNQFRFPKEEILHEIATHEVKAVFLCNPNNPLAITTPREDIVEVVRAVPSTTLVVSDEAYFEYSGFTLLDLLDELPNLLIIRTLSKSFGIPGARIGYCIGAPKTISHLEKLLLPWPIAHTSYYTARQLLARSEKVAERRDEVIRARDSFIAALQEIPTIHVYPSATNFVLIRTEEARAVVDKLAKEHIRVVLAQPMSRFPEAQKILENTIRIAIPSPEDLPRFMEALRGSLQAT